ncbi:MAG: coproporphyrinogen dehydrogenase HemZ [Clostridia bacterium]|nr:coproporphyrinogen dehydrogenase HemZ [Clostridia bacterium]
MLLLNNHSFKYETEQIGLLFFPQHENLKIISNLTEKDGLSYVHTEIEYEGKSASFDFSGVCETKKDYANLIKRSAFGAAEKISDIPAPWGILTGIRPAKPVRKMLEDGAAEDEVLAVLKDTYLVTDKKARLAIDIAKAERNLCTNDKSKVSVYIGIPFCPTRCSYCSFISHDASKMIKLSAEYVKKLCEEIKVISKIINDLGLSVRNLYFGGGTPTALSESELKTLFEAVSENFDVSQIEEFTVEAGRPDTITREKLSAILESGARRISINPQTKWDETLKRIGRNHTFEDFLNAYNLAREMGFRNINCDLIAGLPSETPAMFSETCDTLLKLSPENLTVHTLYIKRASRIKAEHEKISTAGIEEMVDTAAEKCKEKGLFPYYLYKQKTTSGNLENVGYSKRGFECLYNSDTMSDSASVFALGAGGVTKLVMDDRIERVFNFKNADDYINKFDEIIKRKESIPKIFTRKEG